MRLLSAAHQQQQQASNNATARAAAIAAASKGKGGGSKYATAALLCAFVASGLALPYFLSKSGVGVRFGLLILIVRMRP